MRYIIWKAGKIIMEEVLCNLQEWIEGLIFPVFLPVEEELRQRPIGDGISRTVIFVTVIFYWKKQKLMQETSPH